MFKFIIILIAATTIFCSWTGLNNKNNQTFQHLETTPYLNEDIPRLAHGKVQANPIEKKDVIVIIDGKKPGMKVLEIKYLDAKGRIPVRILSVKRN